MPRTHTFAIGDLETISLRLREGIANERLDLIG